MYDQILRTPDLVMISMEGDEYTARPASETVSVKDIQVTTALKSDALINALVQKLKKLFIHNP